MTVNGEGSQLRQTSSFEVRTELEKLLERDLLGPWDGPDEELQPGTSPAARYLLGRLVPRHPPAEPPEPIGRADGAAAPAGDADGGDDPSQLDREVSAGGGDDSGEDEAESDATVRSGSMAASAIGLAFSVPADVDVVLVTAAWGRYERTPSETHVTEQGRPRIVWQRHQAGGQVEVPLDAERSDVGVPDSEQEGVVIQYAVRHRGLRRVVELALVNAQRAAVSTPDTARLYQAGMTVTALDGHRAIFAGHNDPELGEPPGSHDDEKLHLELLHRGHREYAHGPPVRGGCRRSRRRAAGLAAVYYLLPCCRGATRGAGDRAGAHP